MNFPPAYRNASISLTDVQFFVLYFVFYKKNVWIKFFMLLQSFFVTLLKIIKIENDISQFTAK